MKEGEMKWNGLEIIIAGHKLYVICPVCNELVRINKPLLGDIHICKNLELKQH